MSGNRDSITFIEKKEEEDENDTKQEENDIKEKNSTLIGDFYISVKGYRSSFYSIYYYITHEDNNIQEYNLLESGIVYTSTIEWGFPKLFHFFNNDRQKDSKLNKPFIITSYAANCVGNFTIQNKNDYETSEENKDLEIIKSQRNFKTHHNQAFILPNMTLFNQKLYDLHYTAKNFHHKTTSKKSSCLFYISGISYEKELLLSEGIPHFFTFEPKREIYKFNYIYPHVHQDRNPALIDIFFTNKVMELRVKISFESNSISNNNPTPGKSSYYYKLLGPKTIMIKPEIFEKNCGNNFNCNVHISIEYPKNPIKTFSELTYKITARSNNSIPTYLRKNVIRDDSVLPNIYQYHYTDIGQYESGKISLKSKSGSGILVGRIIEKKTSSNSENNNNNESNINKNQINLPTLENSDLKFNHLSNSLEFDQTQTAKCKEGCLIYIGVLSRNYQNFKDHLFKYSIIVNTGNIELALNSHFSGVFRNINDNNNIQYVTINVAEDQSSNVRFNLNFKNNIKGKMLVNLGEINDEISLPDDNNNNYFTSEEKSNIDYTFKLNKQSKKFVVGIFIDPSKYKNSTSAIHYDFFPRDYSNLNNNNFFEIKLGQNPVCVSEEENSYCDFLMILPNDDTIIFHTNFLQEFVQQSVFNFKQNLPDSIILANVYESNQYQELVENPSLRPRLNNSPKFRSDILTESFKEFSQFPDNNILIFKNPYHKDNSNNNNNKDSKEFSHNVLCVSVYLKNPSAFILMNNKKITPSTLLQPETNIEHLYYVDTFNTLNIEVPELIANKLRNLEEKIGGDENIMFRDNVFSVSIKSLVGDGNINYDLRNYKLGHEKKNMKIYIGQGSSGKLKINAYSDKKINLKPYLCIITLNYSPIETNLVLGENLEILYPTLYYPKKFNFFNFNNTRIKEENIDVSFNYKLLNYKGKDVDELLPFMLKSRKIKDEDFFNEEKNKMEDLIFDLGEYDKVNRVVRDYLKLNK